MLKHYFTLVFRNFRKQKTTFLINLIGLSFGLACVVLIYLWIQDERNMNQFNDKKDDLYQVLTNHDNEEGIVTHGYGPGLLADAMEEELPEVVSAAATSPFIEDVSFASGMEKIGVDGLFADQDLFSMFTIPVLYGNLSTLLSDINSVALSESMARKLFDDPKEAVGKSLEWQVFDFSNEVTVSGVYQDFPQNSTLRPAFLMAFDYFKQMLGEGIHWDNHNTMSYVLLKKETDVDFFNQKIDGFIKSKLADSNVRPMVQNFGDTYLHGNYENGKVAGGRIQYVYLFSIIALLVLAIACVNFVNLTTAKAISRSKEVGIKKAIGADRKQLIDQFLVEVLLLTATALILALVLVYFLLPQFNQITHKHLSLFLTVQQWAFIVGIGLFTAILSGIYPALYLSGFKPSSVLKGVQRGSFGEVMARRGLVIFQFAVSLTMIISIIVVAKQISHVKQQNLGYQKNNILNITPYGLSGQRYETFIERVKAVSGVEQASGIFHSMAGAGSSTIGLTWPGKDPNTNVKFENISVGYDLIETLNMTLIEGRSFSKKFAAEDTKIILNEAAIKAMGMDDPIGKTVNLWGADKEIIGVVKDFNFESLRENVKPAFLKYKPETAQHIMVRISPKNTQATLKGIESLYHEISPGDVFEYKFLDENYQSQYEAEQRVEALAMYFGALAILISCLGLFGLAVFSTEKRKKEIGVRKVLGASIGSIVKLITGEFARLILVAIAIAVPFSWFASSRWLSGFAYRTSLDWWVFVIAGLLIMLIAMLTVGTQAFRAANVNPVNSLRDE
ncbi:ABC transporter permease [Echinicola sp. CAU 1574]|uniref:ABC transporter permease n=1 Tax=Echinicola arenosa TaxID=2774144 RepID=A0ABR9AQ55_9BACT|nr:ABC transporter permease [Echinicola arenosa]MBD8490928.1 ABC transporter permease [Echinicola arenosa]